MSKQYLTSCYNFYLIGCYWSLILVKAKILNCDHGGTCWSAHGATRCCTVVMKGCLYLVLVNGTTALAVPVPGSDYSGGIAPVSENLLLSARLPYSPLKGAPVTLTIVPYIRCG